MFRLLTFLGTSSGTPTPYRNVSSACLSLTDGRVWMFDCGEGTQHQLLKCKDVSVGKIDKVFITHLHGDHCYGLPGMLCSMGLLWSAPGIVPNATFAVKKRDGKGSSAPASDDDNDEHGAADENFIFDHFSKTSEFLEIYGPTNTAAYLREVLRSSETRFGFRYRVNELSISSEKRSDDDASPRIVSEAELQEKNTAQFISCEAPTRRFVSTHINDTYYFPPSIVDPHGSISMSAAWLDHPVPSLGYVLVEPTTAGMLDMAKVSALGVPKGPMLSKLKKGEAVSFPLPDGSTKTVDATEVVGPAIEGRKLTMLGDTSNSKRIAELAKSSDWVVHESTFDDNCDKLAVPRGHSTARMAGAFAASILAKKLIITHFSARFPPEEKDPQPIAQLRAQAVEGFEMKALNAAVGTPSEASATSALEPVSSKSRANDVFTAQDFLSVDLSRAAAKK